MLLSDEGRKKLMSFLVSGTSPEKKKDDSEGEGKEESGCEYACEKMITAIKDGNAQKLNAALSEWFEMKPGDNSDSYSDEDKD